MEQQIVLSLLSALIGGVIGTLLSLYIPKWLFDPRLVILAPSTPNRTSVLLVVNKGKTAATNAIGRITLRAINSGDVINTPPNKRTAKQIQDWRFNQDAYLKPDEWGVGIESATLHWQQYPNPSHYNLNPDVIEKLVICRSDGKWVDIPSNNPSKKTARLKLEDNKIYYCDVLISAENCRPVNYKFTITLGENGTAKVMAYKGKLPTL